MIIFTACRCDTERHAPSLSSDQLSARVLDRAEGYLDFRNVLYSRCPPSAWFGGRNHSRSGSRQGVFYETGQQERGCPKDQGLVVTRVCGRPRLVLNVGQAADLNSRNEMMLAGKVQPRRRGRPECVTVSEPVIPTVRTE